jgi:hypothetical protein
MLTMRASSLACRSGRKARVMRTTASKLIAISQSKSASLTCSKLPPSATPALLTSTSTRPCASRTVAGSACDRGAIGDVDDMTARADAERFGLGGRGGEAGGVDVGEGEMAAAPRQREGDAATDAAARARDDGDAIAQLHGGAPRCRSAARRRRRGRSAARACP